MKPVTMLAANHHRQANLAAYLGSTPTGAFPRTFTLSHLWGCWKAAVGLTLAQVPLGWGVPGATAAALAASRAQQPGRLRTSHVPAARWGALS